MLHDLPVLNIECDARPLVVQVQEQTVCISAVNGLHSLANSWRSASDLFEVTVSADRVLCECPFLLMRKHVGLQMALYSQPFFCSCAVTLTLSHCRHHVIEFCLRSQGLGMLAHNTQCQNHFSDIAWLYLNFEISFPFTVQAIR